MINKISKHNEFLGYFYLGRLLDMNWNAHLYRYNINYGFKYYYGLEISIPEYYFHLNSLKKTWEEINYYLPLTFFSFDCRNQNGYFDDLSWISEINAKIINVNCLHWNILFPEKIEQIYWNNISKEEAFQIFAAHKHLTRVNRFISKNRTDSYGDFNTYLKTEICFNND